MPTNDVDLSKFITDIIQKHIVILGPTVVLTKARAIGKVSIDDNGVVKSIDGDKKEYLEALLTALSRISPESVRKTVEPLISGNPELQSLLSHLKEPELPVTPVTPIK
jgi:hypothetical protein